MQAEDAPTAKRAAATPTAFDASAVDLGNPKVRQILEAADRLFLDLSYDAVSTDEIARAAKVSKATLYVYFPSKEQLFATLIRSRCHQIAGHLWQSDAAVDCIRPELCRIARDFMAMLTGAEAIALYRSIVAQSARFPELGRIFYEAGPKRFQDQLADFLGEADRRGLLSVPDPRTAALQFIHLIAGDLAMRGLLALGPTGAGEDEAAMESAVSLFLAGYAPKL